MVNRRNFLRRMGGGGAAAILSSPLCGQQTFRTLLRYPYIQDVRSDSATIMWTALENGAGMVIFSRDGKDPFIAISRKRLFPSTETRMSAPFYQYQTDLKDLAPDSEYLCQVLLDGYALTDKDSVRFRTRPAGSFRFLAYGDSGMGTRDQLEVAQRMDRETVELVVHTGDIAYMNGTYEEFETRHFKYYWDQMRRMPFFPSPGNHEYYTGDAAPYLAVHSVPTDQVPEEDRGRYYSFDWGNVHFIALDSNTPLEKAATGSKSGKMLEWLEKDLQQSGQFWRIPYFHHPPYATGPNERDPLSGLARQWMVPIFDRHEVELVFNGHEHSYQRSRPIRNNSIAEPGMGTVYITTGGGGAWLYQVGTAPFLATGESCFHYVRAEVNGYRMTLETVRVDGAIIDRTVLEPKPLISGITRLSLSTANLLPSPGMGEPIRIVGRRLASFEATAVSLPLPTQLSSVTVDWKGQLLPLWKVSSTEIIAGLPSGPSGEIPLRVTTPNGSAESSIYVQRRNGNRRR